MATNQRKKRAGSAPQIVTPESVGHTAHGDTLRTAQPVTPKRRYKARARRCKCGCGAVFTPSPSHPKQQFATDACRQRDYRAKQPMRARQPNPVDWYTCDCCGERYIGIVGKGRKYCTSTCKRNSAKARREAVALGLATALGLALEDARERVELVGMEAARRAVEVLAS